MTKALRWSETELNQHLAKSRGQTVAGPSAASVASTASAHTTGQGIKKSPGARRKAGLREFASMAGEVVGAKNIKTKKPSRSEMAVQSLRQCRISGSHGKSNFIEIILDGAQMLSVNEVLGMHHFQRIAYKKAWHEVMTSAILVITGGPRHWSAFEKYRLTAHRQSMRQCDNDALNGHFKYAIDGLRYAGLLVDDDPNHMLSMHSTQSTGPYRVMLRIHAELDEAKVKTNTTAAALDVRHGEYRPHAGASAEPGMTTKKSLRAPGGRGPSCAGADPHQDTKGAGGL